MSNPQHNFERRRRATFTRQVSICFRLAFRRVNYPASTGSYGVTVLCPTEAWTTLIIWWVPEWGVEVLTPTHQEFLHKFLLHAMYLMKGQGKAKKMTLYLFVREYDEDRTTIPGVFSSLELA